MLKQIIEDYFGEGAWEEIDHEEVERQIKADQERRRLDFQKGDYSYDHYTDALEDIKHLKRERRHEEVENLLLWCIDFVEEEAAHKASEPGGVPAIAPAYYRHLAIVYRKDDRYTDEVEVLERYLEAVGDLGHDPDQDLIERLERARELASSDG